MGFYDVARRLLWYIDYMGSYAKHLTWSLLTYNWKTIKKLWVERSTIRSFQVTLFHTILSSILQVYLPVKTSEN